MKHTPGPWMIGKNGKSDWVKIYPEHGRPVAKVLPRSPVGNRKSKDFDEEIGNTQLIVAAPDLYAALTALVGGNGREGDLHDMAAIAAAKQAIAKAEGK